MVSSTATSSTTAIARPAAALTVAAAIGVIALEAWDAFEISQPLGAIIAIVLFAAGLIWLRMRGGRGPALYLGVLFALEIVGNFTVFDVLSDLRHQGSWSDFANGVAYTVATVVGLVACLVLTAAPRRTGADR